MSNTFSQKDYDGDEYFFGTCYTKDDSLPMWIPIEKNATKVVRSMLAPQGFYECNYHELKKYTVPTMIILRDPVERWISGLVEYLLLVYLDTTQSLNNLERHNITVDRVFDQIAFDAHTFPQSWFLQGLGSQCEYILFDETKKSQLIETVSKYFTQKGIAHNWNISDYRHHDATSDQKRQLTEFYKQLLDNNPDLLLKVKNFYAQDYELINSVKFYT